jgi:hypothetical protein
MATTLETATLVVTVIAMICAILAGALSPVTFNNFSCSSFTGWVKFDTVSASLIIVALVFSILTVGAAAIGFSGKKIGHAVGAALALLTAVFAIAAIGRLTYEIKVSIQATVYPLKAYYCPAFGFGIITFILGIASVVLFGLSFRAASQREQTNNQGAYGMGSSPVEAPIAKA